jgi:hypothetical protein
MLKSCKSVVGCQIERAGSRNSFGLAAANISNCDECTDNDSLQNKRFQEFSRASFSVELFRADVVKDPYT